MGASGSKTPPMVICLGLDAAGKTTMLYNIAALENGGGQVETTIPTIGFNVETLEALGLDFVSWDVGGSTKLRALWRHYWGSAQALIFVIDSNDRDRTDDARRELHSLLGEEFGGRTDWPVLVLANKQDLSGARSVAEITEDLGLAALRGRQWLIWPTDMVTPNGLDAIYWLKTALGVGGKHPKRNWKQLAGNAETAGELLLIWAAGRSSRGVAQDPHDAEQAVRPHLQQLALKQANEAAPISPYLDTRCTGLWPGYTPLHICASLRKLGLASLLLSAKAAVDAPLEGQTAMSLAIVACSEVIQDQPNDEDCGDAAAWVARLLEAGADPQTRVQFNSDTHYVAVQDAVGPTRTTGMDAIPILMLALCVRTTPAAIEALLTAGADPNAGSVGGWPEDQTLPDIMLSPLHAAILYGDDNGKAAELVALLLAHGATTTGDEGSAALTAAIIEADRETVALLLTFVEVQPTHVIEAASKLDGPMTVRHYGGIGLEGFQLTGGPPAKISRQTRRPSANSLRYARAHETGHEATNFESPAVDLLRLLLEASHAIHPLTPSVANAAALVAVRACSILTLESTINMQSAATHTTRAEGCVKVLSMLEDWAKHASANWSLRASCGVEIWACSQEPPRGRVTARVGDGTAYGARIWRARSRCACLLETQLSPDSTESDHADKVLVEQAEALERKQLPYPTLLHVLVGTATFQLIDEEVARTALAPVARALVAAGVNPKMVWIEPKPPDRHRKKSGPTDAAVTPALRQWRQKNGMQADSPNLMRGSAPPPCTPLALALRESRSVGALTAIILDLDGVVPIYTQAEIAEDEAKWARAVASRPSYQSSQSARGSATTRRLRKAGFGWVYPEASDAEDILAEYWTAGQATLLDELLSRVREQNLSAMKQLLRNGWCCTRLQARRTLAALLEDMFGCTTDWHRAVLEQLLTDTGKCGEVFRAALSPQRFVSQSDDSAAPYGPSRRPLAFALEHHDFRLIKVLLKAGAVLLPCDDETLSAISARTDVCTCTGTSICDILTSGQRCQGQKRWRGEIVKSCLELRNAQQLVMARQRLTFAWSAQLAYCNVGIRVHPEGVAICLDGSSFDGDVEDRVGDLLLTTPLRPGWLGREASRILSS